MYIQCTCAVILCQKQCQLTHKFFTERERKRGGGSEREREKGDGRESLTNFLSPIESHDYIQISHVGQAAAAPLV